MATILFYIFESCMFFKHHYHTKFQGPILHGTNAASSFEVCLAAMILIVQN